MGGHGRAALAAAIACCGTTAIGKNDGGRDRDDADKRERDRRECPDGRELTLANGRIHLLDAGGSVVSSVTIRNGKFVSVGHDNGGGGTPGCRQFVNLPGSPDHEDEFTFDGAASWDPYTAYDPLLDVYREGRMTARVRIFFLSMDNAQATPILSRRLNNAFREFGDDWMRVAGLGEFITNWPLLGAVVPPSNYLSAV